MTMQDAINRIREAVEYYDMVHDTGEEKQTLENKDYVWKGYDRLMEILNEPAKQVDQPKKSKPIQLSFGF